MASRRNAFGLPQNCHSWLRTGNRLGREVGEHWPGVRIDFCRRDIRDGKQHVFKFLPDGLSSQQHGKPCHSPKMKSWHQIIRLTKRINWARLLITAFFAATMRAAAATSVPETAAQHDARMQWFRDAKFGMFIHWGLYSQLAGEWQGQTITGGAEWIQNQLNIPSSQYRGLAQSWQPTHYQPREWVRLMKAAGIKYVCITTKHHDGFCLWSTKMNDDWNIGITPGGTDLLRPLADACHAEGLQFCIYHSVMDWHHADWPHRPAFNDLTQGQPDKVRFKTYLYGELKELFANYGPIGMVWFDGTWDRQSWTSDDGKELEDFTRSLQPTVILNNRSGYLPSQRKLDIAIANDYGYVFAGDYISPEGEVPSTGLPGIDWETCQTMQLPNNWGYNRLVGFRPYGDLLRQLIDVTSKGGNMLLNIGPTAEGEILPQARQCLEKFAAWMRVNGEAIHGTTASPFAWLPFDGRCTQKRDQLYLHVFQWPANGQLSIPLASPVTRAYLLAAPGKNLSVTNSVKGCSIVLPSVAPDPIVSVVVVEFSGELKVLPAPKNLALGKSVTVSGEWRGREKELAASHVNDGDFETLWAGADASARSGWVQIDLGEAHEVAAVLLDDHSYHRTQKFSVQAELAGEWKTLVTGTTIGSHKRENISPVTARRFRLVIEQATDTPTVNEFQIFGD